MDQAANDKCCLIELHEDFRDFVSSACPRCQDGDGPCAVNLMRAAVEPPTLEAVVGTDAPTR